MGFPKEYSSVIFWSAFLAMIGFIVPLIYLRCKEKRMVETMLLLVGIGLLVSGKFSFEQNRVIAGSVVLIVAVKYTFVKEKIQSFYYRTRVSRQQNRLPALRDES